MITFSVNPKRRATATSDDAITTSSVGIPVTLELPEAFDGLTVTLVCKAGEVSRDVAAMGGELTVPHECLQVAGIPLKLGVYARNGAGTIVIPTIWASAGTIRQGTIPSETSPSDPTPSWAAQVQQWAEDAHDTAERLAEEVDGWETQIDAAVQGAETVDAVASKSDTTATIIVTDREGVEHAVTVSDGAQGEAGRDGYSPSATVTHGAGSATITITDKDGTTTATVHDGTNGRDGTDGADGLSPTVDVQAITGGHEVTITDADGAHSFDVMDGDPATPGSITDEMLAPDGIKPQVAQLFGNQLTGTLSGTIDTASDAYAAPPMELTVDGASTQAGTPTPDAPVPILSVDDLVLRIRGTNFFDISKLFSGARVTVEGTTITANAGANLNIYDGETGSHNKVSLSAVPRLPRVPAGEFAVRFSSRTGGTIKVRSINPITGAANGHVSVDVSSSGTRFTTTQPEVLSIAFATNGTSVTDLRIDINPAVNSQYQPFVGYDFQLPVTLRSLPDGTKDELHLSYLRPSTREGWAWYSREVVQKIAHIVDMGLLDWSKPSSSTHKFYAGFASVVEGPNELKKRCTCYVSGRNVGISADESGLIDGTMYGRTGNRGVIVYDTRYSTVENLKTGLSGQQLDILLATPVTTQLDPIELPELPAPNCTVWCDGGSAQPTFVMQYVQDTNIVIADLRAALADLATS